MEQDCCPSPGVLASLPTELRYQIWDYLSLKSCRFESNPPQLKLAILQVSRQTYGEAFAVVYDDVVLQIIIGPKYKYKSWLTIETNFGATWSLQNLDDAMKRGFDQLPYEKLRMIQINIEAPDRRDPGQIICLHRKCGALAALLGNAKHGLPDIELHLLDSTSAKWSLKGKPQQSVAVDRERRYPPQDAIIDRTNEVASMFEDDIEIVLFAFSRIRNARSFKILIPADVHGDDSFINYMAELMMKRDPVGSYLVPIDGGNNAAIQRAYDEISMNLDVELDILPGITASMLRLDRFSSWYTDKLGGESKYERECERIIKAWKCPVMRRSLMERLQLRYTAMRAFNPGSLIYRYTTPELLAIMDCLYVSNHVKSVDEAVKLGLMSDEWDQDVWHNGCYPLGIGPFSYRPFSSTIVLTGIKGRMLSNYEDYFSIKLKDWAIIHALPIVKLYDGGKLSCIGQYSLRHIYRAFDL